MGAVAQHISLLSHISMLRQRLFNRLDLSTAYHRALNPAEYAMCIQNPVFRSIAHKLDLQLCELEREYHDRAEHITEPCRNVRVWTLAAMDGRIRVKEGEAVETNERLARLGRSLLSEDSRQIVNDRDDQD